MEDGSMMGRLLGLVTVAAVAVTPGTAWALNFYRLTAHATTFVGYHAYYCDKPARIHEHRDFSSLAQPSRHHIDDKYFRVGRTGCYVTSERFQLPSYTLPSPWRLRITISDSRGSLRRRSTCVYPPPPSHYRLLPLLAGRASPTACSGTA
jgi:hypothetical protein